MEKLLRSYLKTVIAHPVAVVLIIGLITAAAATWLVVFKPLRLDTNFTSLLPDDLPCVIESRRTSKLVGSTDFLIIAIESPVVEDNIAFAEEIAKKLEKLPELDWVSISEDKSYFRDRRLLYLDLPDLEQIVSRAKARVDYEKKIANPFYIALDDEKPPDISFSDIMDRYRDRLKQQGARGVLKEEQHKDAQKHGGKPFDPPVAKDGTPIDLGDRLATRDGKIMSVVARPNKPAMEMEFGRALVEKAQQLLDESNPKRNPKMRVEVAGAYRNRYREYNSIVGDIFSSLGVALGLILLIVVGYFRRVRTVALIFVPLLVGITWTVALTALTLGRLNMTTALIFAVLLGLGIDFGVHMSMRYLDERARGKSLEESLALALMRTGKAILTAGLTTAGALAVLIAARFKGFSEFGIIATMGIVLCLLIYTLLLPAMAVLMERVSVPKPWRKRATGGQVQLRPVTTAPWKLATALGVALLLVAGSVYGLTRIEFEYNFRNLRGKKISTTIRYGKSLGQGSSPVLAVMPTAEDARALTRHVNDIASPTNVRGKLRRSFSVFTFVPDDQQQKLKLLAELRGYVDEALGLKKLKQKTRERLEEIHGWTTTGEITVDGLPEWVKGKFREKDGTLGRMVYLYPWVDEWKVNEMEIFYNQFGVIDVPGKGEVRPSASGFILVEVVRAVQRDGILMTVVATAVVLILLLVDLRSLIKALFVFTPLVVGLCWTGGVMSLFGIRIGLYNMLVLPTLLGIGIDASVHLYHSYTEHGPGSLRHVLGTTGAAIVIAAATTGVGFVGMTIVNHDGLRSIGILAVIGIVACLAGALLTLPLLLAFRESLKNRKKA
jgi:predicted RND superfamily exporter protein